MQSRHLQIAWLMSALRSKDWRRRRGSLRGYLLEHPDDRTGEEQVAVVGSQSRKRIDLKALADEIGASVGPTIKPAPAVNSKRPGTARNAQRAGGRSRKIQGPSRRGARCSRHR
jgi:hypothetical protein